MMCKQSKYHRKFFCWLCLSGLFLLEPNHANGQDSPEKAEIQQENSGSALAPQPMPMDQAKEAEAPPACGPLEIAEFTWPAAQLVAHIIERLLAEGMNCAVSRLQAQPEATRAAFEQNAQTLIAPGLTAPEDWLNTLTEQGIRLRVGALLYGPKTEAGFFASAQHLKAAPNLRSLAEVATRQDLFADTLNERPKLYLCPRHWACYDQAQAVLNALNLHTAFELVEHESGHALIDSLENASRSGKPWIGYAWTPSEMVAQYQLSRLTVTEAQNCDQNGVCQDPFAQEPIRIIYAFALENTEPEVGALLRRFSLPVDIVQKALAWRVQQNATMDETADYVLSNYPGLWRETLTQTGRKQFELALQRRLNALD